MISSKPESKPYAVIYFESEELYSEVPVSWMTTDKKKCWWPKSLNAKTNMIRGDKPQENWVLYDVRVEEYCSTLKSARLKAENPEYSSSNESQNTKGRGFRKKLLKKYTSDEGSSDEGNITPPPSPSVNLVTGTLHDVIVVEVPPADQERSSSASISSSIQGSHILNLDAYQDQIQICTVLDAHSETTNNELTLNTCALTPMTDDVLLHNTEVYEPSKKCDCRETTLKEVYIKVTKMEKMVEEIAKVISSLKTSNGVMCDQQKLDLLGKLPLKNKEEIIEFEQQFSNEPNMKDTFVNFIRSIGGKDVKDFVNRGLSCMFTNELGKMCSLVGQRGNLRLDGYSFIKIFQEIVLATKGSSSYDVEKAIGEWFRLSNHRLNRLNNKKEHK